VLSVRGEHLRAQALHRQQLAVHRAVGVAQRRELRIGGKQALQPRVRWREVLVLRCGEQRALTQQRIERLQPRLRGIELRCVDARLAPHALDQALLCLVPFGARHRVPGDLGHRLVGAAGEA